jgi:hypothetical protein
MSSPRTAKKSGTEKRAGKPAAKTAPKPAVVVTASPATATAQELANEIERGLADGRPELIAPEALQDLMAALCKCYTAQLEAGGDFLPLRGRTSATSTDIMATASGLLKAANLAVFELGMWQSWTGR